MFNTKPQPHTPHPPSRPLAEAIPVLPNEHERDKNFQPITHSGETFSITVRRSVKVHLGGFETTELEVSMTDHFTRSKTCTHDVAVDYLAHKVQLALRLQINLLAKTSTLPNADAHAKRYGL